MELTDYSSSQCLRYVQPKQLAICPHTLNTQQWDKKRITSKNTPAHKQGNGKHVGLAILKSYQAHGSPLLRCENNFLWPLTPPSGLLVWASGGPSISWKLASVCSWVVFYACFLLVILGVQNPLFILYYVPFISSVTFKNIEDLLWFLLGFIPLDRSHIHKSFCNGSFLTLGFCWGTMSLSFQEALSLTKKVEEANPYLLKGFLADCSVLWDTIFDFWDFEKIFQSHSWHHVCFPKSAPKFDLCSKAIS